MTSTIKVNNTQNSCGANIIKRCGATTTVGSGAGNTVVVCGSTVTIGRCGGSVALASGATQTGFGRTGTVDWDTTPKTTTFTAVSGDGFFADTSSGGYTMNLPAGVAGAIVSVADYAGTWQTGNLTVSPNGTDKIGGVNANVVLNTEGQSVTFIFVDSTQGWINIQDSTSNERGSAFISATGGTETTSGNCKIHTFTGPGTFTVNTIAACASQNIMSHVVVAGGGGGAKDANANNRQGGGGAGGFREVKNPVTPYTASPLDGYPSSPNRVTVTATAFPITVGGGGTGFPGPQGDCTRGSNSIFSGVTSTGGGAGNMGTAAPEPSNGPGGSGGGASGNAPGDDVTGGNGNTPSTTPSQGNNGGNGAQPDKGGGGGGGAGGVGTNGSPSSANAPGGPGVSSSITGSPTTYSPGGDNRGGSAGSANTGKGGGGGCASPNIGGGNGGSGIVIIRYKFQ